MSGKCVFFLYEKMSLHLISVYSLISLLNNELLFYIILLQKRAPVAKAGKPKKKKVSLKFHLDCSHPVEDGIMDISNFVS